MKMKKTTTEEGGGMLVACAEAARLVASDVSVTAPAPEGVKVFVNRRTKREQTPLLFPGYKMQERLKTLQRGACLVGETFELITESLLRGERNGTNSTCDLCPDVHVPKDSLFVESKACGRVGRLLVHYQQLDNYLEVLDRYDVSYMMWLYDMKRPCAEPKKRSIGEVVHGVSTTIANAFLLPICVVDAMRKAELDGCGKRHCKLYFYGRADVERDYLTVSRTFYANLSGKTTATLVALGLRPKDYEWFSCPKRGTRFVYNDIEFRTNPYTLFKMVRRRIESPTTFVGDDVAPF